MSSGAGERSGVGAATSPAHVVVIGGGISGLATALRVEQGARAAGMPVRVTVLEAASYPGGTIRTHEERGFRMEAGPNGFLDGKPSTLRLARDVGLADRLLPADARSKVRYLWTGGRLHPLPASPGAFLRSPLLPLRGRLRVLMEPLARRGPEDESVAEFGRRRLGRHAVERLLDPMVSGVFAGDVERLSVGTAFPAVKRLEQEHGSLFRGMVARARARRRLTAGEGDEAGASRALVSTERPDEAAAAEGDGASAGTAPAGGGAAGGPAGPAGHLHSLEGGMGELIGALVAHLEGDVRTGAPVLSVTETDGGYAVEVAGVKPLHADAVVSAAPAHAAARYLAPLDAELGGALGGIPYAPLAVVALGLEVHALGRPLDGFGFLVPSRENEDILGCLWPSTIFPGHRAPSGHVLLRTMVGGARRPELAGLSEDKLLERVREALGRMLGLDASRPVVARVTRHERAIPQYPVGHGETVARVERRCAARPGLFVTGNHLRGVGVNDCTADAERTADQVLAYLRRAVDGQAAAL